MTAPVYNRREAQSLDAMMAAFGEGWAGLESRDRLVAHKPMQPADAVAEFVYALSRVPDGRALIEWLMDITVRAPFRSTGATIEETALLAATRQGIEGVGEAVLAAIKLGAESVARRQPGNSNATSA